MKINIYKKRISSCRSRKKINRLMNFKRRLNQDLIPLLICRRSWTKLLVKLNSKKRKKIDWREKWLSWRMRIPIWRKPQPIIAPVKWVPSSISMFWVKKRIWIRCCISVNSWMQNTCRWCRNSILNNCPRVDPEQEILELPQACPQWEEWCQDKCQEVSNLLNLTNKCLTQWLNSKTCQWAVRCKACKWPHQWVLIQIRQHLVQWFHQTFNKISMADNEFVHIDY